MKHINSDSPDWEEEALRLVDKIACIPAVHHIGENLPQKKPVDINKSRIA